MGENNFLVVVFFDIQKAFDSVAN